LRDNLAGGECLRRLRNHPLTTSETIAIDSRIRHRSFTSDEDFNQVSERSGLAAPISERSPFLIISQSDCDRTSNDSGAHSLRR